MTCTGGIHGDCQRQVFAKGVCSGHYRALRAGQSVAYELRLTRSHNAQELCEVEGCERPFKARGLCAKHYQKDMYWRKKKEGECRN